MPLASGSHLGPYDILAPLGAGGMGEVYRAKDTKLGREVAVKILPATFTSDPERVARFWREAQVLASLNHPHIAQIYGLDEANGTQFLVLELVDGESLDKRIARGRIPVDEALGIAKQIAEALEAAHEKGIIHRDLKPANIALTRDRQVKVLDFGLAKAVEAAGTMPDLSTSPTITSPAMITGVGVILGTAAYMSPEQAKGRAADRRSDVWAFGCVLYEMLAGRRAFEGEDISETLAAILRAELAWNQLPVQTPEPVRRLLRRCLSKDRNNRLGDLSAARLDIDDAVARTGHDERPPLKTSNRYLHAAWSLVACFAAVVAAVVAWTVRSAPLPREVRLEMTAPASTDLVSLAISPDGRSVVFAGKSGDRQQLWLRSLDSGVSKPLPDTASGSLPFWSPDGRSIGFFADSKLKRLDIDGGTPRALASTGVGLGGAWHANGSILFAPAIGSPILRLPARGGAPVPVTRLISPQSSHRHPYLLPDGRHFLYYAAGPPEVAGVYIGQIDGGESTRLLEADSSAIYAQPGFVFFARQSGLYAQQFDVQRLSLIGDAMYVASQVATDPLRTVAVSAAAAGPIVYRSSGTAGLRQLMWVDRAGKELKRLGEPDAATPRAPVISPDGSRIALTRVAKSAIADIWLMSSATGLLTRFTVDARASYPIWSADGEQIAFTVTNGATSEIWIKSVTRNDESKVLYSSVGFNNPSDWSRDGRYLLFRHADTGKPQDVWVLPIGGDRKPFSVVKGNFDERDGQFSPDGRWIAYQSDESGQYEIYVQRFPDSRGKERVSTNGGAQVRWRGDGKELFYVGLDDRLMAVSIELAADGRPVAGAPAPLFPTDIGGAVQGVARQQYAVSQDGMRFLMNRVPEDSSPITVLLNWSGKNQ